MAERKRSIRSDLLAAGAVFKADFRYRVPPYQRNFSWTLDEVGQLWDDLLGAMEENRPDYFLGTIVVGDEDGDRLRKIIDGQQRLATLTMMFSAIRTVYKENADDRYLEVYQEYLGLRDRKSRLIQARLTLNEVNEPAFEKLVVDDASDVDLQRTIDDKTAADSNRRLARATLEIRDRVRRKAEAAQSFDTFLVNLEDFLKDRVILIQVLVQDESDAYLVFETLNDRGLDLSTSDLLKNYIFGRVGPDHLEVVRRQWSEMTVILGTQSETQFLRHYWLSHYGVVRDRDLYREFKQKFSSAPKVIQLMADLRAAADNYAAMSSSDHALWTGYPTSVRNDIDTLQLFGLSQFRPLLQAVIENFAMEEIGRVLRLIVVVSMRYSIIGAFGTNVVEKTYSDAAIAVRKGDANTPAKVFAKLQSIYPDDERFAQDFELAEITKPKLARFVLTEIANCIQGGKELGVLEDERKVNLEHIMPKTRNEFWMKAAADEAEHLRFVNRIGNLTLIERSINSAVGNGAFQKKRDEAYVKSSIAMTNELAAYADWNIEAIEARQKRLGAVAVKTWSAPYDGDKKAGAA